MERTIFSGSGSWLSEKKVPLRKDIGRITRLMKTLMSW